ncbi:MAG TPA: FG-GAP-like repeat-containing protein [Smithellaceae bacterium]|nr:FG-GAP-like repeat-containing protein [Smithellaceae bacterium]HOS09873.1 FG-GAP-like repeat-containing protein [Smithellaceae bacterium]
MAKQSRSCLCRFSVCFLICLLFTFSAFSVHAQDEVTKTALKKGPVKQVNEYYSTQEITFSDGTVITRSIISGPPRPPIGYDHQRSAIFLSMPDEVISDETKATKTLNVPGYDWVFGCSSVSAAMIAAYYDRTKYPKMYTGPTNGGVMPPNNSTTYWPTWTDNDEGYPNLPLAASKKDVDGRTTRGSIDNYWIKYNSIEDDPYITNSWPRHAWKDAVGDYMKTSQSAYGNSDGSTQFWNYGNATPLTCSEMTTLESEGHKISWNDGTYGRMLFYKARGYRVTQCYNQHTDNVHAGGFSFAQYKAEINAGRPVMINVTGHTMVGIGYDDSTTPPTIYIRDTWDYQTHTMRWGRSYEGMELQSVSIVNLAPPPPPLDDFNADGISDIIWKRPDNKHLLWFMNRTGSAKSTKLLAAFAAWNFAASGDFNADGISDIIWKRSDNKHLLWFMDKTGTAKSTKVLAAIATWDFDGTGDFNADGISDMLWKRPDGKYVLWFMNKTGSATSAKVLAAIATWILAETEDFNADGISDMLWRRPDGKYVLWFMNKTGTAKSTKVIAAIATWNCRASGDFNADGISDIIWKRPDGKHVLWFMNKDGTAKSTKVLAALSTWNFADIGDFNADGISDIIWKRPDGKHVLWFMNKDGTAKSTKVLAAIATWILIDAG